MTTSTDALKKILRQAAGLFGPSRLEDYLQLYAEDSTLHFLPPGLPQGRNGARLFYQSLFAAFDDVRLTIHDALGEGDRVAVRFSIEGTHRDVFLGLPPSGKRLTFDGITIFRFEGHQCVERWSETNLTAVLQQASVG
jgi:steroid delta-isomerase-like uncharacterized protein